MYGLLGGEEKTWNPRENTFSTTMSDIEKYRFRGLVDHSAGFIKVELTKKERLLLNIQ